MLAVVVHDLFFPNVANGGSPWTDGYFGMLLDCALTDLDPSLTSLDAVFGTGAVEMAAGSYSRQALTSFVVLPDSGRSLQQADPIAFGSLEAGFNYDKFLIYYELGDDSLSYPAFSFDISDAGNTRVTDDNPVNINPNVAGYWEFLQA